MARPPPVSSSSSRSSRKPTWAHNPSRPPLSSTNPQPTNSTASPGVSVYSVRVVRLSTGVLEPYSSTSSPPPYCCGAPCRSSVVGAITVQGPQWKINLISNTTPNKLNRGFQWRHNKCQQRRSTTRARKDQKKRRIVQFNRGGWIKNTVQTLGSVDAW